MELDAPEKCIQLRSDIINMISDAGSGHPGGSLSCVEILYALFYKKMNFSYENHNTQNRDRFVLSKGHAAPALYAVLSDLGFFDRAELKDFRQLGSILQGHPDGKKTPGIEVSTGSLGQGVSIAVGMALGAKKIDKEIKIYSLLGDGELQEGLVWEAAMAASNYNLNNLTIIIDNNGLQIDGTNDEVMKLGYIKGKFQAFGFNCFEVDGHSIHDVFSALSAETDKPKCIIAKTIKGKGVSYMENIPGWHGKAPSESERLLALTELGE